MTCPDAPLSSSLSALRRQVAAGVIFPKIGEILEVSVKVAATVIEAARDEDLLDR